MASDVAVIFRYCPYIARNYLRLIRQNWPMHLFPTTNSLDYVIVDLLGPLLKTKAGKRFILVISDWFTKLTIVLPLKRSNARHVPRALSSYWVFKYGAPKGVLLDKGPQFASKLYKNPSTSLTF